MHRAKRSRCSSNFSFENPTVKLSARIATVWTGHFTLAQGSPSEPSPALVGRRVCTAAPNLLLASTEGRLATPEQRDQTPTQEFRWKFPPSPQQRDPPEPGPLAQTGRSNATDRPGAAWSEPSPSFSEMSRRTSGKCAAVVTRSKSRGASARPRFQSSELPPMPQSRPRRVGARSCARRTGGGTSMRR